MKIDTSDVDVPEEIRDYLLECDDIGIDWTRRHGSWIIVAYTTKARSDCRVGVGTLNGSARTISCAGSHISECAARVPSNTIRTSLS